MPRTDSNCPTLSRTLLSSILPWIVLIVVLSGLVLHLLIARQSSAAFDARLFAKAEGLMLITEQDEDGVEFELLPEAQPSYFAESDADYFEITGPGRAVLFRSDTLGERRLDGPPGSDVLALTPEQAADGVAVYRDLLLPDGRPGRAVVAEYFPKIDLDDDENSGAVSGNPAFALPGQTVLVAGEPITPARLTIVLATSRVPLDEQLRVIDLIFIGSGLATILLTLLIIQRAVRRALRPLESLTRELAGIGDASLDRRLSNDANIAELDSLAGTFNGLLEKLEQVFDRERQFTSDVAHELRTPLAELRSHVEVGRRFPQDKTLRANLLDDVDSATRRMQSLTVNLLALSRNELGIDRTAALADLDDVLADVVASHRDAAVRSSLRMEIDLLASPTPVVGREYWRSLLTNLVDNAITYAPGGSVIEIVLAHEEDICTLEISNAAPDLIVDDLPYLFDRLWRKDSSRHSGRHSGLGLALVKAYAETLGASIDTTLDRGRLGFRLRWIRADSKDTSSETHAPPKPGTRERQ